VFEGLFSFLPFQTVQRNNCIALTNFHRLYSPSFFKKSREPMGRHQQMNLYLHTDNAGLKHLQNTLNWGKKYIGKSKHYQHHKDFNDYLVHQVYQQTPSPKKGRSF
jgi:hypothetical protein